MGEFQLRHWHRMVQFLDDYMVGNLDLETLIQSLEATLDASELKDERLRKEFYDRWGIFEIEFAVEKEMGVRVDQGRMKNAASRMKEFLNDTMQDVLAYDPRK